MGTPVFQSQIHDLAEGAGSQKVKIDNDKDDGHRKQTPFATPLDDMVLNRVHPRHLAQTTLIFNHFFFRLLTVHAAGFHVDPIEGPCHTMQP